MSYDFRKDLQELFTIIALAAIAFFFAYSCSAQDNHEPLTLDMRVQRFPVGDSTDVNNHNSLSRSIVTVERVQLVLIDGDKGIILINNLDTLALKRVKFGQLINTDAKGNYIGNVHNDIYVDIHHNNQKYAVARYITLKKKFQFSFAPIPPFLRPDMYGIHISPAHYYAQ